MVKLSKRKLEQLVKINFISKNKPLGFILSNNMIEYLKECIKDDKIKFVKIGNFIINKEDISYIEY